MCARAGKQSDGARRAGQEDAQLGRALLLALSNPKVSKPTVQGAHASQAHSRWIGLQQGAALACSRHQRAGQSQLRRI